MGMLLLQKKIWIELLSPVWEVKYFLRIKAVFQIEYKLNINKM